MMNDCPKTHPLCRKRIRWGELIIEKSITATAFISLACITMIFIFVFREASPLFFSFSAGSAASANHAGDASETSGEEQYETYGEDQITNPIENEFTIREETLSEGRLSVFKKLLSFRWQPVSLNPGYGIMPLLVGSIKVALISLFISAPIGIFAALFSTMFAPKWMKETIKPVVEILAGFPSVVIGFFVLVVLATTLQNVFGFHYRLNAFVGGVALSLAIIPVIYTLSEDAMTAVPRSLIEASLALGAYKWETALLIVLPAATPGIFASVLLGVGRAIGETMIALMVTGNAALLSLNPVEPVRTMAATIGAEMAEVVFGDTHYSVLFFLGVLLFIFSFSLNVIAEFFIRQRLMKRFRGM
jgi:phosphate transport system permease protein